MRWGRCDTAGNADVMDDVFPLGALLILGQSVTTAGDFTVFKALLLGLFTGVGNALLLGRL